MGLGQAFIVVAVDLLVFEGLDHTFHERVVVRIGAPARAALDRGRRCGWQAIMQSRWATAALSSSDSLLTAHTQNPRQIRRACCQPVP
jgi:hypothetical protein